MVQEKGVVVKQDLCGALACLNEGVRAISSINGLRLIEYLVTCVVSLYVLTGCDYVSSLFFCMTKSVFL